MTPDAFAQSSELEPTVLDTELVDKPAVSLDDAATAGEEPLAKPRGTAGLKLGATLRGRRAPRVSRFWASWR